MKDKLKQIINLIKQNIYIFILIFFFSTFHFICHPTYWDDENYKNLITSVNYNLAVYIKVMYSLQTSRVAIEIVSSIISVLPHMVWKILDVCIIYLLFKDLEWFNTHIFSYKKSKENSLVLVLLICAYPFSLMACAGWKITTLNYLWVISTAFYAVNNILKIVVLEKTLSKRGSLLTILALIYSSSFESLAPIMLVGLFFAVWYLKFRRYRKIPYVFYGAILIVCLSLVLVVLCPGNENRLESDIGRWMPEFNDLNLLDKIRMGTVTAFMQLVSIPSPIFLILNACCMAGAWLKKESSLKKTIAVFPLMIDIFWTGYFFVNYLFGRKTMTYQVPSPLLHGGIDAFEQIGLFLSLVIWFIAVFYSLYWILEKKKNFYISVVILLIGCLPEIIVGLSPTVVNSMLRTTIYLYLAMILLIMCLWGELYLYFFKYLRLKRILYYLLICGVFFNAVQLFRHIIIYG